MPKTAIIIGAGPAGLTAAYTLLKETDCIPLILEADTAVGGISRTVNHGGNRMDLGGHRFFTKNPEVEKLWQELMPLQGAPAMDDRLLNREKPLSPTGPDPEKEDRVMLIRDRVSRIYFRRRFFDYPISLQWNTIRSLGFFNTLKAGVGYVWAMLFKRKEVTLKDFMINRFGLPLYKMFFESYNEKLWGRNPDKIAPDWGAQRIKGLSLRKAISEMLKKALGIHNKGPVETSLIEQFSYPKFGPGQLYETMAKEIEAMGGTILFGKEVVRIGAAEGRVQWVETSDGQRYEGEVFFSSMPIKDLIAGMGDKVPPHIREIGCGLPYRDFMTVGLLVDKLKLKNGTGKKTLGDIVPDCWIYVQERDVQMGRIQIFNNWSPYLVKDPLHTVWVGLEYFCSEGDELWSLSDGDMIALAQRELEKMDIIAPGAVLDGVRLKVKKAYPAYFDTYERFGEVREYLNTFENIYCLGRNGQHRYNNMDHSMLTAMKAVQAMAGKGDKAAVWDVNTEEEYHEEKRA
ncbi:MAG: NAD(P)/FAD-dependent oxidoreductase [Clostridia bacterium]|nr:NAD(P)/FAD-dependent oxidoreductase [Clostridia bacterium]